MLGILNFKKDLLVEVKDQEKPRKFTWKGFGAYFSEEAMHLSRLDAIAMKSRSRSELFPKFLNSPAGVGMLSTAFYMWTGYKSASMNLIKGDIEKNKADFLNGMLDGLSAAKLPGKKQSVFSQKQVGFIMRYFYFLQTKELESSFSPGMTYSESLYKFYKLNSSNDPVIISERSSLAKHMTKRSIGHAKSIRQNLKVRVL